MNSLIHTAKEVTLDQANNARDGRHSRPAGQGGHENLTETGGTRGMIRPILRPSCNDITSWVQYHSAFSSAYGEAEAAVRLEDSRQGQSNDNDIDCDDSDDAQWVI